MLPPNRPSSEQSNGTAVVVEDAASGSDSEGQETSSDAGSEEGSDADDDKVGSYPQWL